MDYTHEQLIANLRRLPLEVCEMIQELSSPFKNIYSNEIVSVLNDKFGKTKNIRNIYKHPEIGLCLIMDFNDLHYIVQAVEPYYTNDYRIALVRTKDFNRELKLYSHNMDFRDEIVASIKFYQMKQLLFSAIDNHGIFKVYAFIDAIDELLEISFDAIDELLEIDE